MIIYPALVLEMYLSVTERYSTPIFRQKIRNSGHFLVHPSNFSGRSWCLTHRQCIESKCNWLRAAQLWSLRRLLELQYCSITFRTHWIGTFFSPRGLLNFWKDNLFAGLTKILKYHTMSWLLHLPDSLRERGTSPKFWSEILFPLKLRFFFVLFCFSIMTMEQRIYPWLCYQWTVKSWVSNSSVVLSVHYKSSFSIIK